MSAQQIIFFKKSVCDYSEQSVTATASEGNDFAANVLNRNNTSNWITTGSTDASLTTLTIDFVDSRTITDILLIKHNFKNYTVKYWDGSAYQAFSTPIAPTTNTAETNHHTFNSVSTTKIQVTVNSTQTLNAEKFLYQLIATTQIGQFTGWPIIKKPTHSLNRQKTKMLSGKVNIVENVGNFMCDLNVACLNESDDLDIIEALYENSEGFLVWLCGGDENQFSSVRKGYRLEDIYLMKCSDDYTPEYYKGFYNTGVVISIKLEEVI